MQLSKQTNKQLKQLKLIREEISKADTPGQKKEVAKMVKAVYQEVKETKVTYLVLQQNTSNYFHADTYKNYARQAKNKTLAELQDIETMLNGNECRTGQVLAIINRLIKKQLYIPGMQDKINDWKPNVNKGLTELEITI